VKGFKGCFAKACFAKALTEIQSPSTLRQEIKILHHMISDISIGMTPGV
jgi:hypothetical protein